MSYEEKYMKYKRKYLEAKRDQLGGNKDFNIPDKELAVDEIYVWGRQMGDHALFLHLLLEDPDNILKKTALELNKKWEIFMKKQFIDKGIPIEQYDINNPKAVKIELTQTERKLLSTNFPFNEFFALLKELKDFKTLIQKKLQDGEWIGWIYPSFIDHILMELENLLYRIQGKSDKLKDMNFYNKMSKDHAAFADNLTDYSPEYLQLKEKLRDTFNKMPELSNNERDQYIILSLKYVKDVGDAGLDLQQKIHSNSSQHQLIYKGIIHPALIDHVVREQQRAELKLREMK